MRLPHRATVLRPSRVTDVYGDEVDGPLAPVGSPFPAWLQARSSTETEGAVSVLVSTPVLYYRDALVLIEEDDVVEVEGRGRFNVVGEPYAATSPRGRVRHSRVDLKRVSRGGS